MFASLLDRWANWIGDRSLEQAIQAELRRGGFAVHASKIIRPRLVAIERPGWVQVHRFEVETLDSERHAVRLFGAVRDDGRSERPRAVLTHDRNERDSQLDAWCEGLIRRD